MWIIGWIKNHFLTTRTDCYNYYKSEDEKCYGIVGETKETDYLSEDCIDCKYLSYTRKQK